MEGSILGITSVLVGRESSLRLIELYAMTSGRHLTISADASFLPEGVYDHSPIVIHFYPQIYGKKPFKIFNFWAGKDSFIDMVKETWKTYVPGVTSYQIQQKLKLLKYQFKQQFQHTPIQVTLLKAQQEFAEAQEALHRCPTYS